MAKIVCLECHGNGGELLDTGGSTPWGDPVDSYGVCSICMGHGIVDAPSDLHHLLARLDEDHCPREQLLVIADWYEDHGEEEQAGKLRMIHQANRWPTTEVIHSAEMDHQLLPGWLWRHGCLCLQRDVFHSCFCILKKDCVACHMTNLHVVGVEVFGRLEGNQGMNFKRFGSRSAAILGLARAIVT